MGGPDIADGPRLTVLGGALLCTLLEPWVTGDEAEEAAQLLVIELTRDGVPEQDPSAVAEAVASAHERDVPVAVWVTDRLDPRRDPLPDWLEAATVVAALSAATATALGEQLARAVHHLPAAASLAHISPASDLTTPPRTGTGADRAPVPVADHASVDRTGPEAASEGYEPVGHPAAPEPDEASASAEAGGASELDATTEAPADPPEPEGNPEEAPIEESPAPGDPDPAAALLAPTPAAEPAVDDRDPQPPRRDDVTITVVQDGAADDGALADVLTQALSRLDEGAARGLVLDAPAADGVRPPRTTTRLVRERDLHSGFHPVLRPVSVAEAIDAARRCAAVADASDLWAGGAWLTLAAMAGGAPAAGPGADGPAGDALPETVRAVVERGATRRDLHAHLTGLLAQPEHRDRWGHLAHRAVLTGHTTRDRVYALAAAAGLPAPTSEPATVSAIVPSNREHELENVLANVGRQSHRQTELVLVLHGIDPDEDALRRRAGELGVEHLTLVRADVTLTLGACLNLGVEAASGHLVAKMDDDNYYGPHYLADLQLPLQYTDAGIVGKWAHYAWLRSTGAVILRYVDAEHRYERRVQGGAMLFDGDLIRRLRFRDLPRAVDSDVLDRASDEGVRIYSADRFNYVSVRGHDRHRHTWAVEDPTFLTPSGRLVFHGDPREHVSI